MGYHFWHRISSPCLAGLASFLFPLTIAAQTPDMPREPESQLAQAQPASSANAPVLTLADCLRIARERQPALQAYRASLAAAEDGSQALQNLPRFASLFAKDLPVRKDQACLG